MGDQYIMPKKKVKLKTGALDLVEPLLKLLKKEKEVKNGDTDEMKEILVTIVESIAKCLRSREELESDLIGYIGQIERLIRWSSESDENQKRSERENCKRKMSELMNELTDLVNKAHVVTSKMKSKMMHHIGDEVKDDESNHTEDEVKDDEANHTEDEVKDDTSSNIGTSKEGDNTDVREQEEVIHRMKNLNPKLRDCAYSLGIFPVEEKLKKRLLIYWWIGLGLVPLPEDENRTTEQDVEIIFYELINQGILIPDEADLLPNQAVKWCTIQPKIHKQLINDCKREGLIISEDRKEGIVCFYRDGQASNKNNALLNLNQKYLDSADIKEVLADNRNRTLQVLQFGWWRCLSEVAKKIGTREKKSIDHIEVDSIDFLKQVGEKVRYLSLRGISSVDELPRNIGKLQNLMILDLRACHNLEKLPEKEKPRLVLGEILKPILPNSKLREAKWFKSLTHLDMSECYLLDHMPKWVCELSNLEVLKGFVVSGKAGNKDQFCQIDDLSKLKKLRKLSIKVTKILEDTRDFKYLENLSVLTITWKLDVGTDTNSDIEYEWIVVPKNLEKLDMRCYPYGKISLEILSPEKFKRLYIRGGKLREFPFFHLRYNLLSKYVQTLRLRSLQSLRLHFSDLTEYYCPELKCVEYYECPELEGFPEGTHHIFPTSE